MGQDTSDLGRSDNSCSGEPAGVVLLVHTGGTISATKSVSTADDDGLTVEATSYGNFSTEAASLLGQFWDDLDSDEKHSLHEDYKLQRAKAVRLSPS